MPRIALGVASIRQNLDELISGLEEPVAITVQGRRVAVLVPYGQYMALVRGAAEEEELPEEGGG